MVFESTVRLSGRAMVLGYLKCFFFILLGQGPTVLAVGAGSVRLETFSLVQTLSETVVELLFYVHGKHLRSCRDGQLT